MYPALCCILGKFWANGKLSVLHTSGLSAGEANISTGNEVKCCLGLCRVSSTVKIKDSKCWRHPDFTCLYPPDQLAWCHRSWLKDLALPLFSPFVAPTVFVHMALFGTALLLPIPAWFTVHRAPWWCSSLGMEVFVSCVGSQIFQSTAPCFLLAPMLGANGTDSDLWWGPHTLCTQLMR
jgi:hypothetical protein